MDLPTTTERPPSASGVLDSSAPATLLDPWLRPSMIGRYHLLERLGEGGMGVVYAAYDPKLDRKIALKLLRPRSNRDLKRQRIRQARLLREAQALAKLSHPNVITVHDVDLHDETLYMAMEFVEGVDVARWLIQAERSVKEILEVFVDAARGLAAAHAVGITHRDFKPHNVLIGDDARVRVLDFGLAKPFDSRRGRGSSHSSHSSQSSVNSPQLRAVIDSAADPKLTKAGRCVGTPAYMAPEQVLGHEASPAADQFSFGASLYEALYRVLPYGDGEEALWRASAGELAALPEEHAVPDWVHRILARTLKPRPEERYPSMDAVIAALLDDPTARRRTIVAASAGVFGGAVLLAGFAYGAAHRDEPCRDSAERLAPVWDDDRREAIEDAFEASKLGFAGAVWSRIDPSLQTYADAWVATHRSVCEATHVRKEQSATLMDVRMTCLQQHRNEFDAVLELLSTGEPVVIEHAVAAVRNLDDPNECVALLDDARTRLPDDPRTRAEVEAIQAEFARAFALIAAGKHDAFQAAVRTLVPRAETVNHRPTNAHSLWLQGNALERAGEPERAEHKYREAALLAAELGDAQLEAEAWMRLLWVVGLRKGQLDRGLALADAVHSALRRAGDPPAELAELHDLMAGILAEAGRLAEANEHAQQAVELTHQHGDRNRFMLPQVLSRLGTVQARLGQPREAEATLRLALSEAETIQGPEHPLVSEIAGYLGNVLYMAGRGKEAEAALRRAIAVQRAAYGDQAHALPDHLTSLAVVLMDNQPSEARAILQEAREHYERQARPERLVPVLNNLGSLAFQARDYDEAARLSEEAHEVARSRLGEDHLLVHRSGFFVCRAKRAGGDLQTALDFCERAVAGYQRVYGTPHLDTIKARLEFADTLQALGEAGRACSEAEGALELARLVQLTEQQDAEIRRRAKSVLDHCAPSPSGR